jgi:hypothetical protein
MWVKSKVHPITCHKGTEGDQRYITPLSLTTPLYGVDGQRHDPAAIPPGMTRYPLHRSLCGPHGRSGQVQRISPTPEFDPRTVQPVASPHSLCHPGPL